MKCTGVIRLTRDLRSTYVIHGEAVGNYILLKICAAGTDPFLEGI